ncbi:MAG: hypothetical protein K6U74_06430 [Firmicutes bacterium]|nr:hypothetical protein [Bacillota bacterium]
MGLLPKWLVILIFMMAAGFFAYDLAGVVMIKRDMQTSSNISATSSIVSALDPAPLRVGESPRINEQALKDNFQDMFVKNFNAKNKRADVKLYSYQSEPPAVVVTCESPVNISVLSLLKGGAQEKNIRSRSAAVYEAKGLTK